MQRGALHHKKVFSDMFVYDSKDCMIVFEELVLVLIYQAF